MIPRAAALWLLPRYAGGTLPSVLAGLVKSAIDTDVDVAAAYAALRQAERALLRDPSGLSAGQKDLLLSSLLGDLDGATATSTSTSTSTSRAPASSLWSAAGPVVAAAACVGLFIVGGADDKTARGAAHSAPLGVRVRCISNGDADNGSGGVVTDEATAGARQTGADLDCAEGSLLAFSATNLQAAARYVFVVGIDDEGERVWLPPFLEHSAARALPAGSTDAMIDTLAPMPPTGVTLFVLLDDEAFSGDDVERRVAAAVRSGVPVGRTDKLPVDVFAQGRMVLRLAP